MENESREYIAFISYRHKPLDTQVAKMVQQRIERYKVPKEYRERTGVHPGIVFRDEDELPISSSLSDSIMYALDHSRFLIVICSRSLRESKWCEAEVDYFIRKNGRERVIAVLAEGTPEESFPLQLLHTYDENGNITGDLEPLAANLVGENHRFQKKASAKETTRIIAALLGCPFDALWQRERRRKTNRFLMLLGIAASILAIFLAMMIRKNGQISAQNEEISRQNSELQRQLSTALVDTGRTKLNSHDVKGALQDALDALLNETDGWTELYDHRAETLLTDALGAYQNEHSRSSILFKQSSDIAFLAVSSDGNYAYLADRLGVVNCVDIKTGALCWTVLTSGADQDPGRNEPALFVLEDQEILICKNTSGIMAVSLENGEPIWEYRYHQKGGNNFRGLSPDGNCFMIMDSEESSGDPGILYALDTRSGEIAGQTDLSSPDYEIDLDSSAEWYRSGCIFSEDGTRMVAAVFENVRDEKTREIIDYQCMFFLIETKSREVTHSAWLNGLPRGSAEIIYGMDLLPQTDNLFCAIYIDGLITTSVYNWEDMTSTREFTNQTIRSIDGMNSRYEQYKVQPMLANEHLAIVFSDTAMLMFDRNDGSLIRNFEMQGKILQAWWADQKEDIVAFLMDNGQVGLYDLEHGDGIWESYSVITYDQDDILLAVPVNGGICTDPQNGMYLTVSRKDPYLLQVRQITDPGLEYLMLPDSTSALDLSIQAVPSGEKVLIFCTSTDSRTLTVVSYDTETDAETDRCSFDIEVSSPPVILDDTHFIAGCKIYDLDAGSWEYLEGLSEESPEITYESHFRSIRLADGRVLTAEDSGAGQGDGLCSCWLNGKLVPESAPEGSAGPPEHTDFQIGANGWVLAHGTPDSTVPSFIAFHAAEPVRKYIEDPLPENDKRLIAMGTHDPVFACAYSDGQIMLFDMDTGSVRPLDTRYSPREIQSLCFAEGDAYLLILTMSARLDVYDLSDDSFVMSEVMTDIKEKNEDSGVTYGLFTNLSCLEDPELNRLHVFASEYNDTDHCWACIDNKAWIVTAHASHIYTCVPENKSIYAWKPGPVFLKYPMYSLKDLSDWAAKELQ